MPIYIRYVDVIWFIFHVLKLLPIRFTQPNSWCINKSMMKYMQKPDLPLFRYGYRKRKFVDLLTGYIGSPNCVHCRV